MGESIDRHPRLVNLRGIIYTRVMSEKRSPWYTIGYEELRFLERSGPSSTDFQREWLYDKSQKWDWSKYRRQAGFSGLISDIYLEYKGVVDALSKAQASRIIDYIIDNEEPISIIDLLSPKK